MQDKQDRFTTCVKTCGTGPIITKGQGLGESPLVPKLGRQAGLKAPLALLETRLLSTLWDLGSHFEAKT